MVKNGFYDFLNWFDERAWYPLGRIVGGTVYPGLMITSGTIHYFLSVLNIPVHIRSVSRWDAKLFLLFKFWLWTFDTELGTCALQKVSFESKSRYFI